MSSNCKFKFNRSRQFEINLEFEINSMMIVNQMVMVGFMTERWPYRNVIGTDQLAPRNRIRRIRRRQAGGRRVGPGGTGWRITLTTNEAIPLRPGRQAERVGRVGRVPPVKPRANRGQTAGWHHSRPQPLRRAGEQRLSRLLARPISGGAGVLFPARGF